MRIQQLYEIGWMLLPGLLYLALKKYYLDHNELYMILACCGLIVSILIDGWIMQVVNLLLWGVHAIIVLQLCVIEFEEAYRFRRWSSRSLQKSNLNIQNDWIVKIKIEQTIVPLFIVILWIILRIYVTSSHTFGIGSPLYDGSTFQGLLVTLSGWNCTFIQFTVIPTLWLLVYCFSWFVIDKAIKLSNEDKTYKQLLLNFLIQPCILNFIVVIVFNLWSHLKSQGLLDCYYYWNEWYVVLVVIYWGLSLITLIFFLVKHGKIQLRSNSSNGTSNQYVELGHEMKVFKFKNQN